jgi:hypothetical protein
MAPDPKKRHYDLMAVGLRAQATATGFLQLCKELHGAGVLDDDAVGRIKSAVADELTLSAPRSTKPAEYRREVGERLDRLFSGEQDIWSVSGFDSISDDEAS